MRGLNEAVSKHFYDSKVTFDPLVKVHQLYTWSFAYREARKSTWPILAIDRLRFQKRIKNFEEKFVIILKKNIILFKT